MKIVTIISGLLCASSIIASPLTKRQTERQLQRRQSRSRRTLPPQNLVHSTPIEGSAGISSSHVDYSDNWAGAVLIGKNFTSVTGKIVVPTASMPPGGNRQTQYAGSPWVGIDGYDDCSAAILQTGIDFYVQGGQVSWDGWWEYYPEDAVYFDTFELTAGDIIQMTVTATSKNSGTVALENLNTGQSVSQTISNRPEQLCLNDAEWIVEDYSEGDSLVPFANFHSVEFTSASAVSGGARLDASGATIVDISQNGKVLTACSASGSDVSCTYKSGA
jgi:hypothetical protein